MKLFLDDNEREISQFASDSSSRSIQSRGFEREHRRLGEEIIFFCPSLRQSRI